MSLVALMRDVLSAQELLQWINKPIFLFYQPTQKGGQSKEQSKQTPEDSFSVLHCPCKHLYIKL